MVKKKFLGGYGLLFGVLCCLFLGFSSTSCYASTTLTDEQAEYLWDYFTKNTYNDVVYDNNINNFRSNNTSSTVKTYSSVDYNAFKTHFNNFNDLDISEKTYFFTVYYSNSQGNNNFNLLWFNFNNTIDDNLPYLYLEFNQNMQNITLFAIDDNHNPVTHTGRYMSIEFNSSGVPTFFNINSNSFTTSGKFYIFSNTNNFWNTSNENYSTRLNAISGLTNFARQPLSIIYSNFNGNNFTSTPESYFYRNYFTTITGPSPDIPEDTGNTGQITDDNGDITGNIDLSGIQNGIGQINQSINEQGQAIIVNQNQNTEQIVNALTNSETEQDTESTEEQFEDMISSTANVVDPTTNFFSWLIDNIRSVLNSTGDYNITITLFEETYTIRSDFFKLPDGDLKTFLQMSFIAWFGWRIIKKIRYIVYAIQCVQITDALHNCDFNADIL